MQDVFRFIQGRPADLFAEQEAIDPEVESDFVDEMVEARASETPATVIRNLVEHNAEAVRAAVDDLAFKDQYGEFFEAVDVNSSELTFEQVNAAIETIFSESLENLASNENVHDDHRHLYEFLLALKFSPELQKSLDFNPARYLKLTHLIRGGDVRASDAAVYFQKTFVRLPNRIFPVPSLLARIAARTRCRRCRCSGRKELATLDGLTADMAKFESALKEVSYLSADDTKVIEEAAERTPTTTARKGRTAGGFRWPWLRAELEESAGELQLGGQLLLSDSKVSRLSRTTREVFEFPELDPATTTLPSIANQLEAQIDKLGLEIMPLMAKYHESVSVSSKAYYSKRDHYRHQKYGSKDPQLELTELKGCGVGDLLVAKEQIKCYEAGEIAHIENILKGEAKKREHRRLKRTEETFILETEESTTEEREHETTERFELQKTASKTIERDQEFKAGVGVKAKYGPFVEVQSNADFSQSSNVQTSQSNASTYSKDVTDRAATTITNRVREEQIRKVIIETEETNSHELNNIGGSKHTVGIYQWVDKILEAQVYRYGLRTLCDFMVPEPAAFYVHSQVNKPLTTDIPTPPPAFDITPANVTRGTYRGYAATFKADGIDSPPEQYKTVSEPFDASSDSFKAMAKTGTLLAPAGYRITNVWALASVIFADGETHGTGFGVGGSFRSGLGVHSISANANGEIAFYATGMHLKVIAGVVHGQCEVTSQEFEKWQLDTFDKLLQAHTAQKEQYEEALAASEVAEGVQIEGRNPGKNRKIEEIELKKSCLSAFTGQHFDGIGAIQFSPQGYPEVDVSHQRPQLPAARARGRGEIHEPLMTRGGGGGRPSGL